MSTILILQGGLSHKRHFSDYHIFSSLLKKKYNIDKIESVICNGLIKNCDFSNPGYNLSNKLFYNIRSNRVCNKCSREVISNIQNFVDAIHFLDHNLPFINFDLIEDQIQTVKRKKTYSSNEFISLRYKNINIGKYVFETFQRTKKLGRLDTFNINNETYLLNLLRDAYILTDAVIIFFEMNKFKFIITNEFSYMYWSIFTQIAFNYNIPVFHICYKSRPNLVNLFQRNCNKDLQLNPFWNQSNLDNFFTQKNNVKNVFKNEKLRKEIEQYYDKPFVLYSDSNDIINNLGYRDNGKKNIFIYCHLNWDSSLSYGTPLFSFFEDWIEHTLLIANNYPEYNWIFKLHPIEKMFKAQGQLNIEFSTLNIIKRNKNFKTKNMYIIEENLSNDLFINDIDLAISSGGSVCYQLPQYGIPVINVNSGLHGNFGFTHDPKNICEYEKIFNNESIFDKLTDNQKTIAELYETIYLDESQYFDTNPLIYDANKNEKEIDKTELEIWINNNIHKI